VIDARSWEVPPLFQMLRSPGSLSEADWRRTFNLGAGIIFVVPPEKLGTAQRVLRRAGETPWVIGEVAKQRRGKARVEYR
jgi:phosphoribosylformylglycinamidine cyclo-ligase